MWIRYDIERKIFLNATAIEHSNLDVGHLTFLRGKIFHFLEQDSYRNQGLSIYEIASNGTTTKLKYEVQELNYKKSSRLREHCSMQISGLSPKDYFQLVPYYIRV